MKQKSKTDLVEVGDNWKTFFWPSKSPVHPLEGKTHVIFENHITNDYRSLEQ